jgi:hypothetical protein
MPLSRAQTVRNRIAGRLRQNATADVTDLRRAADWARLYDYAEAIVESWGSPTPEEVHTVAVLLYRGPCHAADD